MGGRLAREEEPDHLGGRVGTLRIGVGPGGIAAVPRVPATVNDHGLGNGDTVDAVVGSSAVRPDPVGANRCRTVLARHIPCPKSATDELLGIDRSHDRVFVAVDDDQGNRPGHRWCSPRSHGGKSGPSVVRRPVADARVHAHRGIEVRVGRSHDRSHRAAGGQPGDVDAGRVDGQVAHDLSGDAGDDRRLARAGALVRRGEPVPVAAPVGRSRLLRIDDQEGVAFGQLVHARAGGEVDRVLCTAVEHHDKRDRVAAVSAGNIEVVTPRPRGLGVVATMALADEASASRRRSTGLGRRSAFGHLAEREVWSAGPLGTGAFKRSIRRRWRDEARWWRGACVAAWWGRASAPATGEILGGGRFRLRSAGCTAETGEAVLQQRGGLRQLPRASESQRLAHLRVPVLAHACPPFLGGSRRQRGLHRLWRPKRSENLDSINRRQREFGRDVLGDGGQAENAQLHHGPRCSELLEVATAVVLAAERQLAPGHGSVHRARPTLKLAPDRRAYEIRPIREEALVHEEIDLTQIDQPDVDRDLLALITISLASRDCPAVFHLLTILPPSTRMVLGWRLRVESRRPPAGSSHSRERGSPLIASVRVLAI